MNNERLYYVDESDQIVREWDLEEENTGFHLYAYMTDNRNNIDWSQSIHSLSWLSLKQLHRQLTEFICATEHLHEK